ncbi:hypothetical protein HF086_006786 [Spodoptera exigua]|uniref:GPI ethanolamine phosphate transferase 2 C-terminal domain-containing protein n=1 Tax=Spodoptera exigua TaxID=7107 RepID=A0A922SCZ3_SPOEX|nr:hypothetical protein HF086_006786 [Spodoptera exigua]
MFKVIRTRQRLIIMLPWIQYRWTGLCLLVAALATLMLFLYGFFPLKYHSGRMSHMDDLPNFIEGVSIDGQQVYSSGENSVVLMVIDGLRYDFVTEEYMPYTGQLLKNKSACIYVSVAEPPTVTMPRIKAMMTGSVSTFADVALNFGAPAVRGDSVLRVANARGRRTVMYGDDTWLRLFPGLWSQYDGTTSFYVTDYTEVDNNVTRHLDKVLTPDENKKPTFDFLVLHYLGLDHIGHLEGARSPKIKPKLQEMDEVVKKIFTAMKTWDRKGVLIVCGDHGMRDAGGHGGATPSEVLVPLVLAMSSDFECPHPLGPGPTVAQVDVAPSVAWLLGAPPPGDSGGRLLPALLPQDPRQHLYLLHVLSSHAVKQDIPTDTVTYFLIKTGIERIKDLSLLNELNAIDLLLIGATLFHCWSFFGTSFIEEEHMTWYFFWNTLMFFVLVRTVVILLMYLSKKLTGATEVQEKPELEQRMSAVGVGILPKWTGDRWLFLPDTADWLNAPENVFYLQAHLVIGTIGTLVICLWNLRYLNNVKHFQSMLTIAAVICIFCYRIASSALETPIDDIKTWDPVKIVDVFWAILIAQFLLEIVSYIGILKSCGLQPVKNSSNANKFEYNKPKAKSEDYFYDNLMEEPWNVEEVKLNLVRSLSHLMLNDLMLIVCLLMRPHNVVMVPRYVGLRQYCPVRVALRMGLHAYAGPAIAGAALFATIARHANTWDTYLQTIWRSTNILAAHRVYCVVVYCVIATIFRDHLFVWSVFSPKLLYDFVATIFSLQALGTIAQLQFLAHTTNYLARIFTYKSRL